MRRRHEILVGILTIVAIAVMITGTIWFSRGGLRSGYPLYTRFTWGEHLRDGQTVRLAGVAVGYVDKVKLGPGFLDVKLAITDKDFRIPLGTVATVDPVGIFGDVQVTLSPPSPLPTATHAAGDTIPPGDSPPSIGLILSRVDTMSRSVDRIIRELDREFVQGGGLRDMHRALTNLGSLSDQLRGVAARQDQNLTATLASLRNSTEQVASRFATLIDSAAIDSTMRNIRSTSANLQQLIATFDSSAAKLHTIMARIDAGEGSLGILSRDPTLALQLQATVSHLDSLFIDLKRNPSRYFTIRVF
jgi:phospholipid/cholesterol/gamma-HCH transport system substrate-binding protein